MYIPSKDKSMQTEESFGKEKLERSSIKRELLLDLFEKKEIRDIRQKYKNNAFFYSLAYDSYGDVLLEETLEQVQTLYQKITEYFGVLKMNQKSRLIAYPASSLSQQIKWDIHFPLQDFQTQSQECVLISSFYDYPSTERIYLDFWFKHLFYNFMRKEDNLPFVKTYLIMKKNKEYQLLFLSEEINAQELEEKLSYILLAYALRDFKYLAFFPKSSLNYIEKYTSLIKKRQRKKGKRSRSIRRRRRKKKIK